MFIRWDKGKNNTFYLKLASSYRDNGKVKQEILYLGKFRFEFEKFKINYKLIEISRITNRPLSSIEKQLFKGRSKILKITSKDKKDSPYAYERYISLRSRF